MENMREYWAREAEMMRDKSAVLGNIQQVLERPTYGGTAGSVNVLIVQVTKDGTPNEALQNQYDKLKNDLHDNKQWDIMCCQNIEDAADKLSQKPEIDNLVYLHHGSDWGFNPPIALAGPNVKKLIDERDDFLVKRILLQSGNKLDEKSAKTLVNKSLLDTDYKEKFIDVQKKNYKDYIDWQNLIRSIWGVESLLKKVKSNGTFVDASCFQGNKWNSEEHTVFDSLRLLSFENINIYVNTNATGVETSKTLSIGRIGEANSAFLVTVGTIMNHGLTSGFQHDEGWIYFESSTKSTIVTKKDLMLNSYKKPVIEKISYNGIDNETNKNRQLWFSNTFRDLKREDVKRWMSNGNPKRKLDEKLIEDWFIFYTKGIKKDAKL